MSTLRITYCEPDGSDPNRVMDLVGGPGWLMNMEVAIQCAISGTRFWTMVNGNPADVTVAQSVRGNLFLRTDPDSSIANNLGEICRKARRAPRPPIRSLLTPLQRAIIDMDPQPTRNRLAPRR